MTTRDAVQVTDVNEAEAAETHAAGRNALSLATSLGMGWSIAVVLRLLLPRVLGPERFGELHFSESFAATFMVFSTLGLDTYVRRHLSVNPATATEFLGGALLLRAAATGVLMSAMVAGWFLSSGKAAPLLLVLGCGAAQAALSVNTLLAALMDARGLTRKAAPLAVASKAVYVVGVAVVVTAGAPLFAIPLCMLFSEACRGAVLWRWLRIAVPGPWPVNVAAAFAVVASASPFFLNQILHSVCGELDVSIIALGQGALEAGLFGAANNLAALTLVLMPLLPAVLMPAGARAASRSREELDRLMGKAWRGVMLVCIPLVLFLTAGANDVVTLVFGEAYATSALPLVILAPTVVVTYASTLAAIQLIQLDRTWFVTVTSVVGLVVNVALNIVAIPAFYRWLGSGGAGAGAAAASCVTEVVVLGAMMLGGVRAPISAELAATLRSTVAPSLAAWVAYLCVPAEGVVALLALVGTYAAVGAFSGAWSPAALVRVLRVWGR